MAHEFVLAGYTKDRVTYNQLNITQWMAGFCRIMREEHCQQTNHHKLDYLIALLDDSNDFSWQAAKASYAVFLCRMEEDDLTSWSDMDKIDRIQCTNTQTYSIFSGLKQKNQSALKGGKSMPRVYSNDNSCNFSKYHETKGVFYRHICSSCFGWKNSVLTVLRIAKLNI